MVCYKRFRGGGRLPNKRTRMLVVSLRDVNCKRKFWSHVGLWIKKFTKNAVVSVLVWSPIRKWGRGGGGVSLASPSWSPLRLVFSSDTVGLGVVSEVVRTRMT